MYVCVRALKAAEGERESRARGLAPNPLPGTACARACVCVREAEGSRRICAGSITASQPWEGGREAGRERGLEVKGEGGRGARGVGWSAARKIDPGAARFSASSGRRESPPLPGIR